MFKTQAYVVLFDPRNRVSVLDPRTLRPHRRCRNPQRLRHHASSFISVSK
jgi:hypothetical protein